MILGDTGPLGGGKSLIAVMDAYRFSLAAGGAPIWANMTIRESYFVDHQHRNPYFKVGKLETAEDIVRMVAEGGGIAVFDEVHRDLDARLSTMAANILLSQFFMFLRKAGITAIYTTQDESQIDRRLRRVTDILTLCRAYGPKEQRTHEYQRIHYLSGRDLGRRTVTYEEARRYHAMYNTYEFTRRLKFPSNMGDFEKFMLRLEAAADHARQYDGEPDRAWEAFLSATGDSKKGTRGGGQEAHKQPGLRKSSSSGAGNRRGSGPVKGSKLETEAT